MEPGRSPAQLIAESKGLLLDFDGPVCDVYAGSDPARIAREVAAAFDLEVETDDPLDLITHAIATGGPVDAIHHALTMTEIEAVRTATETPGARRLLEEYHGPVAIVSNNATGAIDAWLTRTGLRSSIEVITGRDPRHMKPDPRSLEIAIETIGCQPEGCIFVGDSMSDIEAALRADVPMIALANRQPKRRAFEQHGSALIIDSVIVLTAPVYE